LRPELDLRERPLQLSARPCRPVAVRRRPFEGRVLAEAHASAHDRGVHAYRSAYDHVVGTRLRELSAEYDRAKPHLPAMRRALASRYARAAAGAVGISGAVAMVVLAIASDDEGPTYALLGAGILMVATYALVRIALGVRARVARDVLTLPALSGETHTDLARLDRANPLAALRAELARIEPWSLELPLVATSLLAPLTLHFFVVTLLSGVDARSFATWIRVSLAIVGHAHIALAVCAVRFARKLRREEVANVHREWGKALAVAVGVAAFPGVILFVVPPALSALTGGAFIPWMFLFAAASFRAERFAQALALDETVDEKVASEPAARVAVDDAMEPTETPLMEAERTATA